MRPDNRICDGVGLWIENLTLGEWTGLPGLFLDRDGVVVEETGYLGRPEDVHIISGAAEAIKRANQAGIPVIIVTNQSGVGRGYYNWQDFEAVQSVLYEKLKIENAHIDLVVACAYHKDALSPFTIADHPWRKPNPGMMQAVAEQTGILLSRSALAGDKWSDVEAAARAEMACGILVKTGYGSQQARMSPKFDAGSMSIEIVPNLKNAMETLERHSSAMKFP